MGLVGKPDPPGGSTDSVALRLAASEHLEGWGFLLSIMTCRFNKCTELYEQESVPEL